MAAERGLSDNYLALTKRALTRFSLWLGAVYPDTLPRKVKLEHLTDYLIADETCQTLAIGGIVPFEIEDWEDGRAIEPEPYTNQTIGQ